MTGTGHAPSSGVAEHTQRPPLWVIYAITVTGITVNTLITPAIPDILDGLDVRQGLAGLVVGAGTLPGVLLAPVIGVLADRFGRREVIVPCLVLFAVSGGLGLVAPNLGVLLLLRFLQGTGSAGLINLAVVLIGDHWSGQQRATLIGRNSAVLTVCLAVFPLLGGGLTDLGSWRTPFAVYPVALLTAVLAWRYLPTGIRRDVTVRSQLAGAWPYLRAPRVVALLAASVVLFGLIFGALLTVLPLHAQDGFGLGPSLRGVLLAVPAIGSSIAAFNLGRAIDRFGRRGLLLIASGLMTAGLVVIGAAGALPWLLIGVILFGLAEGSMIPTLQDMATGAAPTHSRGALVAAHVSAARVGQTVGPIGASAVYATAGAFAAFTSMAALAVVAMVPLLWRATARRDVPPGDDHPVDLEAVG